MANDYPQIVDKSTLTGVLPGEQFMLIGIEGVMTAASPAVAGLPQIIATVEEAATQFGADSSLTDLISFVLSRGIVYVTAVASGDDGAPPTLAERKTAWEALEDDPTIRIRLTDDTTQATLVALADSCEAADSIQNKQFCFVGIATPTTKAGLAAAAAAVGSNAANRIAGQRAVLVGPGIYSSDGTLLSGAYAAAAAACEVAKNPDITDSLNGALIAAMGGVELEVATGLPLFRLRANGGAPINDFQDLLTDGASPLQQDSTGVAAFTHLRTTWVTDDRYDALMTLLIKDFLFVGIRDMLLAEKFLRMGNTADNRSHAAAKVDAYLTVHNDIVQPIALPDGTTGYGVTVTPSPDEKEFTVAYNGEVVRGTNVINIAGSLTIPVS